MLSTLSRISSILIVLMCLVSMAKADTALIYHSNYSDAHTNVKSQLEADGYTVTLSTSGSIADNLYTNNIDGTSGGYDVVVDLKYNNNIGSNGRSRYDDFVKAGGVLIVTGENETNFSSRNSNIEKLISNKFGGSLTMGNASGYVNSLNSTYTNFSIDSGSNMLYIAGGASLSGDGEWVAKIGSTVVWMVWEGDDLPSGYDGAVYVTGDINQFTSSYMANGCSTNCTAMNLISDTVEYSVPASTPQAAITTSQQTTVNTARSKTQAGNKIYMTQSGSGIDLDIVQDGDDNLIIGTDLTNPATITGDNILLTITQKNNDNVLGIDINGNSNDVDIWQDTSQRAIVDITGATNTVDLEQLHLTGSGAHHSSINVAGNSNSIIIDQKETGDKILFLDVDGSNTVDIDQLGTGDHFLDVNLTDNHTVTVTQDGSGSHSGYLNLSGNPTSVTVTQDSSTNQNYHLQQSCATTTCSVSVTQN